jgi:hypothetical protein
LDLSLTNILVDEEIIPAEQAVRRVCPGGYWHVPTHGDHSAHDMSSIYLIKQETTSLPKIATRVLHLVLRIPAFLLFSCCFWEAITAVGLAARAFHGARVQDNEKRTKN